MEEKIILGKSKKNKGYTIFKNLDEDMVNAIKTFKGSSEIFNVFGHENAKIVQKLDEKQNLCIDKKGEYFVATNKQISEASEEDKLENINKKFNVADAIKKTFGTLYGRDGYTEYKFYKSPGSSYDGLGSMASTEIGLEFGTYNGIKLSEKSGKWSSIMFCHLNEDGNIENRDYNIDLAHVMENKPKTKEDLIAEIINNIPDVTYENYANKWFTHKFAFILHENFESDREEKTFFSLELIERATGDNYGSSRTSKVKKPKATTKVTRNHILQRILPILNEIQYGGKVDLSKYITIENLVEEKKNANTPTKRIQKTKINENKFEVFDFTEENDILEEKELMDALKDIENSINIPENATIVLDFLEMYLGDCDLPSFSFNKGEQQEDHSDFKGLVKMPHGCNFTFTVAEGDPCEITWSHSIYETDVIGLELVE